MDADMAVDFWITLFGWSLPEHTGISDDLDLLLSALQPAHGKRFISISSYGSGEAAIALAAFAAGNVFAYDIEDVRTLRLLISFKLAAANRLGHDDYLSLMGLRPAAETQRLTLFDQVLADLSGEERMAWSKRRHWARKGIYHANQETFFLQLVWGIAFLLTSRQTRNKIVFSEVPDERSKLFRRYVARPWIIKFFDLVGSRVNIFFPESEWKNSEYPRRLNRNPFSYFEHLVSAGLINNPLFAHHLQDKKLGVPEKMTPPHMRKSGYSGFRSIGNRIRVQQSSPKRVPTMELDGESCHGAYLSNIIDYLNQQDRAHLCKEIARVMMPGAPVLIYSNESFDKVPVGCGLEFDAVASAQLKEMDKVRIYTRVLLYRAIG
jgi:S-adenosylmethionine:diacylglycerol 3-amino-3-carboxypropyl transferase